MVRFARDTAEATGVAVRSIQAIDRQLHKAEQRVHRPTWGEFWDRCHESNSESIPVRFVVVTCSDFVGANSEQTKQGEEFTVTDRIPAPYERSTFLL